MQIACLEERRKEVARLLVRMHMRPREIGEQLGIHMGTVYRDIKWLKKEWEKERISHIDDLRMKELAELDEMEKICMEKLEGCANPWQGTRWIEERRKIKERRAKMLGLDAPDRAVHMNANIQVSKDDADKVVAAILQAENPLAIPMDEETPEAEILDAASSETPSSD